MKKICTREELLEALSQYGNDHGSRTPPSDEEFTSVDYAKANDMGIEYARKLLKRAESEGDIEARIWRPGNGSITRVYKFTPRGLEGLSKRVDTNGKGRDNRGNKRGKRG